MKYLLNDQDQEVFASLKTISKEDIEIIDPEDIIEEAIPWNKGITGYKNKPCSKETKQKISKSMKGKSPWMKGKKHTKETKEKLSMAKKDIPLSKEHRKAISEGLMGHTSSEKQKEAARKTGKQNKIKKAKTHEITKPNGSKIIIKDLKQWCLDNNIPRHYVYYKMHGWSSRVI